MAIQQTFNTIGDLDFPFVLPTLDLDFSNSKALDSRITFTRSSGGSYVDFDGIIKYANVNEARFDHNPTTRESLGLLIEESRTNLFTNSSNFDDISWVKNEVNVFSNAEIAPDGSLTAYKLIENTTFNQHQLRKSVTANSGEIFTFSCFAKAAERTQIAFLLFGTDFSSFDLSNGTVISTGNNSNVTITPYPNGWYRCSATFTSIGDDRFYIFMWNNSNSYQGDGISGVYIWGAQLEKNSFGTSYIPTGSSSVTRSADNASITGRNFSSWYNSSEGSIYSTFINNTSSNTDSSGIGRGVAAFSNGSSIERIRFGTTALGNSISVIYISNNITQSSLSTQNYTDGTKISIISSYKSNYFTLNRNNFTAMQSSTKGSIPIITQLEIGRSTLSSGVLNGTISRFTYFPKALSQSNLQSLTT